MSKPDETIKEAVKETLGVLTEHIQPGDLDARGRSVKPQDREATLEKVTTILDNPVVEQAIEESDQARDDARRAAVSQHPHPEDYPKQKHRGAVGGSD
jgi:hypothetical protein